MKAFLIYIIVFGILAGSVCIWWTTRSRLVTAEKAVTGQIQKYNKERKAILEEIDKIGK